VWTEIYAAQSSHPRATPTFSLAAAPRDTAPVTITGLDDEWPGNNPIVITVNGVEIFAVASPVPSGDGVGHGEQAGWTVIPFTVPAGTLHEGGNEFALTNQAPSTRVDAQPCVLVSEADLIKSASKTRRTGQPH
jgi:hypothetical protein